MQDSSSDIKFLKSYYDTDIIMINREQGELGEQMIIYSNINGIEKIG